MRSIQFDRVGIASEVLNVVEVPIPVPGSGEVRIKIYARPIHYADIMFIRGTYGVRPTLPSVVGFEGAGVVDAVGENTTLSVGDRVIFYCAGAWQDFVVVPESRVIITPEGISDKVACMAFVNPFTAVAMLDEIGLKPGDWLLQTAGASSLGKVVIAYAKELQIKTICTVRKSDQIRMLKSFGADEVIDTEMEHLFEHVMRSTGNKGVTAVIDAVGGKVGAQALSCLADGTVMYVYGFLSKEETPISNTLLIFKNLTIKGFWLMDWFNRNSLEKRKEIWQKVENMLVSGKLTMEIEDVYGLDDVIEAVKHAQRSGRVGKVILAD